MLEHQMWLQYEHEHVLWPEQVRFSKIMCLCLYILYIQCLKAPCVHAAPCCLLDVTELIIFTLTHPSFLINQTEISSRHTRGRHVLAWQCFHKERVTKMHTKLCHPAFNIKRSSDSLAFIPFASDDLTASRAWEFIFQTSSAPFEAARRDVVASNAPPCKIRKICFVDVLLNVTVLFY